MKNELSSKLPLRPTVGKACRDQHGMHTSGLSTKRESWGVLPTASSQSFLEKSLRAALEDVNSPPLPTYYWVGRGGPGSQRNFQTKGYWCWHLEVSQLTWQRYGLRGYGWTVTVSALPIQCKSEETDHYMENFYLPWPCLPDRTPENRGGANCVKRRPYTPFSSFHSKSP